MSIIGPKQAPTQENATKLLKTITATTLVNTLTRDAIYSILTHVKEFITQTLSVKVILIPQLNYNNLMVPNLNSNTLTSSIYITKTLQISGFHNMNTLYIHVLSKLTGSLMQSAPLSLGTSDILITQPLLPTPNTGTISNYLTQPLYNTLHVALKSEIRVFLRYRSSLAKSALNSPILQVIRRTLKTVATNTFFLVNPHSLRNCHDPRSSSCRETPFHRL